MTLHRIVARPGTILGRLWLALLLVAVGTPTASAQVNVESLRKSVVDRGVGGKVDLSVATYSGNIEGLDLGSSGLVGGSVGRHLMYLSASGRYSKIGGRVTVSRAFTHARYNYALTQWLALEVLGQLERDQGPRIELRALAGSGLRATLVEGERVSAYGGATYFAEHNRLNGEYIPVRPATVHRASLYLTGVTALPQAGASFSSTVYLQPRLGRAKDIRVLWESLLAFDLAEYLTAGINAKFRHESPTIAGVKKTDLTVTNTIGIRF